MHSVTQQEEKRTLERGTNSIPRLRMVSPYCIAVHVYIVLVCAFLRNKQFGSFTDRAQFLRCVWTDFCTCVEHIEISETPQKQSILLVHFAMQDWGLGISLWLLEAQKQFSEAYSTLLNFRSWSCPYPPKISTNFILLISGQSVEKVLVSADVSFELFKYTLICTLDWAPIIKWWVVTNLVWRNASSY